MSWQPQLQYIIPLLSMDFESIADRILSNKKFENESKNNKLVFKSMALAVIKREADKAALLKLKGFDRADIERKKGKHSVVCRHWLRNMCMKGEFCDFLHQLVYSRMPPCTMYSKIGYCPDEKRGQCTMKHVKDEKGEEHSGSDDNASDTEQKTNQSAGSFAEFQRFARAVKTSNIDKAGIWGIWSGPSESPPNRIKCFIVKSAQIMNIYYSIVYGVWATGPLNTKRFAEAFAEHDHVVVIFSGNESGGIQGYVRLMTPPIEGLYKGIWGNISSRLGPNFRVKWIRQCSLEFTKFSGIVNPLNDNLPLKKSRDGTELPLDICQQVCNIICNSPQVDLLKGTPFEHWDKINHDRYFEELAERRQLFTPTGLPYTSLY